MLIQSFSFMRGIPSHTDFVFDVRILRDPSTNKKLHKLTGKDSRVIDYVMGDENFEALASAIIAVIQIVELEYPAVSIGCMGGTHRSVVMADYIANYFEVKARHLDL